MIYLLRHGKLKTDHQKRFIGQVDLELSKTGLSQASNWAKWLIPVPIDKIYASDLNRTATTAKIIAEQIKRPIHFEAGFREINLGRWENLPFTEAREKYPVEWAEKEKNLIQFRPPQGESFKDLYERVTKAFKKVLNNPEKSILVVAHAGVNRMILCYVLGMPLDRLFRIEQDYSALNIIDEDKQPIKVIRMNKVLEEEN